MTPCCLPATINLHRPWWRAWFDELRFDFVAGESPHDRRAITAGQRLEGLSPGTLKDIGVPPWLQAHDEARRDIEAARSRAIMPW